MLQHVLDGKKELKIAKDIVSSPTYSVDVAYKIKEIIDSSAGEINRNDLIEKLQKTDEDLPIETHLSDLVDEM